MTTIQQRINDILHPFVVRFAGPGTLTRIARSADSVAARLAAIEKLHDPDVLLEIVRRDKNWKVQQAAFAKMPEGDDKRRARAYMDTAATRALTAGDEELLRDIARTARCEQRRAAIANPNLSDQALFADIALTDEDGDVRLAALCRITDQNRLLAIACRDDERADSRVRREAVSRVVDGNVLQQLALHDPDGEVRLAAVERVDDQQTLETIARSDEGSFVRKAAVERLTGQTVLEQIASTDKEGDVRLAAIIKARYAGDPQRWVCELLDSSATAEEKQERIRRLWTTIQENSLVPARDIIFCQCGYPTEQVFSDGTIGPIRDLVIAETDPFEEYTKHFSCPRCKVTFRSVTH